MAFKPINNFKGCGLDPMFLNREESRGHFHFEGHLSHSDFSIKSAFCASVIQMWLKEPDIKCDASRIFYDCIKVKTKDENGYIKSKWILLDPKMTVHPIKNQTAQLLHIQKRNTQQTEESDKREEMLGEWRSSEPKNKRRGRGWRTTILLPIL